MRFSDATGRPVVSATTAQRIGRVTGFVVDPATRAIAAVAMKKWWADAVLPWAQITAFGPDAVMVDSATEITKPPAAIRALLGKDHTLMGKRALTSAGDQIGHVADVDFDPDTGFITALSVGSGNIGGVRLVGVGAYAVVIDIH